MVVRRRVIGAVAAGVVLLVAVVWIWGRPWWQAQALTNALQDIPGVASVKSAPDETFDDHPYVVTFTDNVSGGELSRGVERVERALDDHEIDGDRAGVEMRATGFVLEHSVTHPIPPDVLRGIIALRDVAGLTGIEADEVQVTASVRADTDLMPVAVRSLKALAKADLKGVGDTSLRLVAKGGGADLRADLGHPEGQLPLLRKLSEAAAVVDAKPYRAGTTPSIRVFGSGGGQPNCSADLQIADISKIRDAAKTLIERGPGCVTLWADQDDETFSLTLLDRSGDPDRALDLRDSLSRVGAHLVHTDTGLNSLKVAVDDAADTKALTELTLDKVRWTPSARANLTVVWNRDASPILADERVDALRETAPMLVPLSRPGFLPSVVGKPERRHFAVSDATEGAPDLKTPEGRQAFVDAARAAHFSGAVRFSVYTKNQGEGVSFTSTRSGRATRVVEPDEHDFDNSWTGSLIDAWNDSAS